MGKEKMAANRKANGSGEEAEGKAKMLSIVRKTELFKEDRMYCALQFSSFAGPREVPWESSQTFNRQILV